MHAIIISSEYFVTILASHCQMLHCSDVLQIDYPKLADMIGYKNPDSVRNAVKRIRKKFEAITAGNSTSPAKKSTGSTLKDAKSGSAKTNNASTGQTLGSSNQLKRQASETAVGKGKRTKPSRVVKDEAGRNGLRALKTEDDNYDNDRDTESDPERV